MAAVHPDWSRRIYGRGRERHRLRHGIEELGLYNNVFLMGVRTPMHPEWAKGALAVVSSSSEPSGMSVVGAMSCGLPVVSADCDHAPREIITHGQDGLMVPDDGPVEDALADALCRLIENDAERRRMAAAARRSAERFRPEHIAAQYEALFTRPSARARQPVDVEAHGRSTAAKSAAGPDSCPSRSAGHGRLQGASGRLARLPAARGATGARRLEAGPAPPYRYLRRDSPTAA
ncbi:glycosyltransferase [Streptomyces viridochromogenes]|uniref:glycosyltransferase n=1 Tax=Streptomyces viridochromogenes TaxID=1938 RepID=UPI00069DA2DC|nr:glycosyltransferase [Streptomyces viridochromogenes]